jgi:hypothetical protein
MGTEEAIRSVARSEREKGGRVPSIQNCGEVECEDEIDVGLLLQP